MYTQCNSTNPKGHIYVLKQWLGNVFMLRMPINSSTHPRLFQLLSMVSNKGLPDLTGRLLTQRRGIYLLLQETLCFSVLRSPASMIESSPSASCDVTTNGTMQLASAIGWQPAAADATGSKAPAFDWTVWHDTQHWHDAWRRDGTRGQRIGSG